MKIKAEFFQREHIPTKVRWMNDPRIHASMYFDLPATVEKTQQWFDQNRDNDQRVDFTFLSDGEIVAMSGLAPIDLKARHAQFYVMVHPDKHGKGIGKKVSFWTYNFGFDQRELNKIYLYTNDDNQKAYAIYEKAGFKLEGVLRQQKWKNGRLLNRRFYGMLREEWAQAEWKKETTFIF